MDVLFHVAHDALLHAGHEHPSMWWVAVAAVLSFVLGVGVGAYALDLSFATDDAGAPGEK